MDKFHTFEDASVPKEVALMVNTFLEGIIHSVGKMIKHFTGFAENETQTTLSCYGTYIHSVLTDVIRILINRFPSLIIYILEFKVPMELIDTYFKKFEPFHVALTEKHNSSGNGLGFIDFLWMANPFIEPITQQFFGFLAKNNYCVRYITFGQK